MRIVHPVSKFLVDHPTRATIREHRVSVSERRMDMNGLGASRSGTGQLPVLDGHGSSTCSPATDKMRSHAPHKNSKLLPALVNGVTKGSWAIMDQGLFALSNFLLNVILARMLTPSDYGAFSVVFSVVLLISAVYFALLIEPMLVFGAAQYAARYSEYLNLLALGHWALVAPASLFLLVSGSVIWLWRPSALSSALIGFAFAGPLMLLTWFLRRACYLRSGPRLAALGGLLYFALTTAGLFVLYRQGGLSISSALGLLTVASFITILWLSARLHIALPSRTSQGMFHEILKDHWGYGRWAVATTVLIWAAGGGLLFLLLPLWHGLDAGGALKALMNLTSPLRNIHIAFAIFLLPMLAGVRGTARFGWLISLATIVSVVGSAVYWVPVVVFHRPLLAWLYGGRYQGYVAELWFLGMFLLASAVAEILTAGLRAIARPDLVFRANILATVGIVTLGVWGIARWGVAGAAGALALASATRAVATCWYYHEQTATVWRREIVPGENPVV